jgi:citrate synthase
MGQKDFVAGLEDVIAGTSDICFIDGKEGRLVYSGYNVDDLVNNDASFEEVIYLLHNNRLPNQAELNEFKQKLYQKSFISNEIIDIMKKITANVPPMVALRTCFSLLQGRDLQVNEENYEDIKEEALNLVAKTPTLVAAIDRIHNNQEILQPKENLSLAANFLYMLQGEEPDHLKEKAMNVALILHADHEFNASTFSARVTAATQSDLYSAIVSAVGTLKGPLHGGANEEVMRLLIEIDEPEQVEKVVTEKLDNKVKISGFGHRVYKTMDPRALHLKELSKELGDKYKNTKWYKMTEKLEQVVYNSKKLYPNVDLYSASAYYVMGINIESFTPVFAVSRIAGWTAHVLEQYRNNRLIRPGSVYTGATNLSYTALEKR